MHWSEILVLILSIFLVALVLLQSTPEDAKSAFSGESSELFKNQKMQGAELIISRATIIVAALWIFFNLFTPSDRSIINAILPFIR